METTVSINKPADKRDYFPALFTNKDNSIIVLRDESITDTTFSGMIIYSKGNNKKQLLGTYSNGWTHAQFSRLPLAFGLYCSLSRSGTPIARLCGSMVRALPRLRTNTRRFCGSAACWGSHSTRS